MPGRVASWQAMLRIIRPRARGANARLKSGLTIEVLANNSDGNHAHGTHTNVADHAARVAEPVRAPHAPPDVPRRLAGVEHRVHRAGQGRLENGASPVDYQITQRGSFRDPDGSADDASPADRQARATRALCGGWGDGARADDLARVHSIFFDCTLSHGHGAARRRPSGGARDDRGGAGRPDARPRGSARRTQPLRSRPGCAHAPHPPQDGTSPRSSCRSVSRARAALRRRRRLRRHRAARADEIVALWADTLALLRRGDEDALARRLDWVLKRRLLRRARWSDGRRCRGARPTSRCSTTSTRASTRSAGSTGRSRRAAAATCWSTRTPSAATRPSRRTTRVRTHRHATRRRHVARVDHVDWDVVRVVRRTRDATRRIARVDLPIRGAERAGRSDISSTGRTTSRDPARDGRAAGAGEFRGREPAS